MLAYMPAASDAFSDEWIVRLVRQGDGRAFEQIVERHGDHLYRYCRGLTGHAEDAEEALQTALLKAFQGLRRGDRVTALRPWLFTIARNACLDLVRQRPDWTSLTPADEAAGGDPGDLQVTRERFEGLRRDLADLKELHRSALLLRELNGLSHREIGDALGTSPESAKRLIFEARESLVERAAGRELACADVRARISEHDGRMLRARRVRAHLDACPSCADYRASVLRRPRQLAAMFPLLPGGAAARVLQGLVGAGAAGGGGGGGLAALLGSIGGGGLLGTAGGQTAAVVVAATLGGAVMVPAVMVADRSPQVSGTTLGAALDIRPPAETADVRMVRVRAAVGATSAGLIAAGDARGNGSPVDKGSPPSGGPVTPPSGGPATPPSETETPGSPGNTPAPGGDRPDPAPQGPAPAEPSAEAPSEEEPSPAKPAPAKPAPAKPTPAKPAPAMPTAPGRRPATRPQTVPTVVVPPSPPVPVATPAPPPEPVSVPAIPVEPAGPVGPVGTPADPPGRPDRPPTVPPNGVPAPPSGDPAPPAEPGTPPVAVPAPPAEPGTPPVAVPAPPVGVPAPPAACSAKRGCAKPAPGKKRDGASTSKR